MVQRFTNDRDEKKKRWRERQKDRKRKSEIDERWCSRFF